ncbi:hypothetical protein KKA15_02535 [Patescibacteria group bacterium]|nr:hypothetical protein [Patescibacteria group bacterium]
MVFNVELFHKKTGVWLDSLEQIDEYRSGLKVEERCYFDVFVIQKRAQIDVLGLEEDEVKKVFQVIKACFSK